MGYGGKLMFEVKDLVAKFQTEFDSRATSSPRKREEPEAAPQQEVKRQRLDTGRCDELVSTAATMQWRSERESGDEVVPGAPVGRPTSLYWPTAKEHESQAYSTRALGRF